MTPKMKIASKFLAIVMIFQMTLLSEDKGALPLPS